MIWLYIYIYFCFVVCSFILTSAMVRFGSVRFWFFLFYYKGETYNFPKILSSSLFLSFSFSSGIIYFRVYRDKKVCSSLIVRLLEFFFPIIECQLQLVKWIYINLRLF